MDPQAPAEPTPSPGALPPLPQSKPLAPKVFGIIHLVLGVMGLIWALIWARLLMEAYAPHPGLDPWIKILAFIAPLLAILLIVAGIGLLSYKRYGRTLSIAYGFLGLLLGIVSLIMTLTVVVPGMMGDGSDPVQAQAAMMTGIMVLVGTPIGMIYPLVLVIFFLRAKSKAGLD